MQVFLNPNSKAQQNRRFSTLSNKTIINKNRISFYILKYSQYCSKHFVKVNSVTILTQGRKYYDQSGQSFDQMSITHLLLVFSGLVPPSSVVSSLILEYYCPKDIIKHNNEKRINNSYLLILQLLGISTRSVMISTLSEILKGNLGPIFL